MPQKSKTHEGIIEKNYMYMIMDNNLDKEKVPNNS